MNSTFAYWQQAWDLIGWTMIDFLAVGTIVLLVGGALRMILKRAKPIVRYATSLAVFAVLALLPIAIAGSMASRDLFSREAERVADERFAEKQTTNHTNSTKESLNAEVAKSAEVPTASRERQRPELFSREAERVADERFLEKFVTQTVQYLPWLWLVGTPLTFLLLATGLIGAERLRRSCQFLSEGPIRATCDEMRAALRAGRDVGVAICNRIATPLLVGVVRPLILLPPAALNGWTTDELEMVLLHELAHVRRWDNAVNLAQRIVEALLFFHPAVWIVSGWVRRDREDCCDAVVVAHTAKPQAYAELLLALASHQPLVGLAATGMAQHPVASRIRRILKLEDEPMLVSRKGLMLGVSVVLAAVLLVCALPSSEADEAPATVSREAERVGDDRSAEVTTNQTNDTNQELNAESAKKAEGAENNLTEYTTVYDIRGSGAKYSELLDHMRGLSEFHVTFRNDDQIVVTARRSVQKSIADFLASMRDQSKQAKNNSLRPIIYAEQAEKLSDGLYKFSFLVPWVRAVDDPARRATTETLIKSDMLLSRALKEMDLFEGAQTSVMDYLRKELSVHYSPDGHMFVSLVGAEDGEAAVAAYAAPIINEYLKEHLTHRGKNQHDLATKDFEFDLATTDVAPAAKETVSREAERVGDERASTDETANLPNDEDVDAIRRWFEASNSNPPQRVEYAVPVGYANEMEDIFEGFQNDPYGPRVSFEWKWLEKGKVVSIEAPQKAHDKWFGPVFAKMAKQAESKKETTNQTNDTNEELNAEDAKKNPLFPTLEEQRAADLAYKLLGVEVEMLSDEELERVTAKGYRGGLRVSAGNQFSGIGQDDLLVGLHVWPTESLRQLTEILSRDDLNQLSPLKFYVIRGGGGGRGGKDQIVTDRVSINLDAWRAMRNPMLQELVALEKQIQEELAEKEHLRDEATAKDRVMLDAEIPQLREILNSVRQQVAIRTSQEKVNTATGVTPLYDGKSFEQWRDLWKTELKTENRIECIKAFAAFGRAGKGKEAAEAILEVAGQYDYGMYEGDSTQKLKGEISQVLSGEEGIAGQYWLPLLIERLESDPQKWSSLTQYGVLDHVQGENVGKYLKQIASDTRLPAQARGAALAGLAIGTDIAQDQEVQIMVREALSGDDTAIIYPVLGNLKFNRLDLFPQQIDLLFHKDPDLQRMALASLANPEMLDHILAVLDDPQRASDYPVAVRAIRMLPLQWRNMRDKRKADLITRLEEILIHGDVESLPDALLAVSHLNAIDENQAINNLGNRITDKRRKELEKAIEKAEELKAEGRFGGGMRGGYMGGGGAF